MTNHVKRSVAVAKVQLIRRPMILLLSPCICPLLRLVFEGNLWETFKRTAIGTVTEEIRFTRLLIAPAHLTGQSSE